MAKYSLKADLVLDEEYELKPITKESPYYDLHSPENLFLIEKINEMKEIIIVNHYLMMKKENFITVFFLFD